MCKRGEIYFSNLGYDFRSDKQCGSRPVIVISNNRANRNSSVVTVIPMTSRLNKKPLPTHVFVSRRLSGLEKDSIALAEQITNLDKDKLERKVGEIADEMTMDQLTTAIQIQLGFYDEYN